MKKKSSACLLVLLIIAMLVFSRPMKMTAAADDSDLFFTTFAFLTNEDKLPTPEIPPVSRLPAEAAATGTARLFFSGMIDQGRLTTGQEFRVQVMVDPGRQSINLADLELIYSTSTLQLLEIDTASSDYSLNLINKSNDGTASLIAMQPWPGIATTSQAADLIFVALQPGSAKLDFATSSAVLANDGYGTDVLKIVEATVFSID